MRTTLNIDDAVLEDLMKYSGEKTKTKAVVTAIEDYVRRKKRQKLISLFGKIEIEDNWRELRELEKNES